MSIVRLGQLHAEDSNVEQLALDPTSPATSLLISDTEAFRTGLRSFDFQGSRPPSGFVFPATNQFWASVWFRHTGVSDVANNILTLFRFSGGAQMRYVRYLYPENRLELSVNAIGNTAYAYNTGFMRQQTWMHFGIHFKAHETDGFCSFYLDSQKILGVTGNTLGDPTSCYVGGIANASAGWAEGWFDDFYVESTEGEVDSCPPPKRFIFSLPNAVGQDTEWTPVGAASNYQAVDEAPQGNEADYVEAAATNLIDTYNVGAFTLPIHWDIAAVLPQAWARVHEGAGELDLHLYDGMYGVGASKTLTDAYATYWDRFTTRPSGGAWDEGSIDTIQTGYERTV